MYLSLKKHWLRLYKSWLILSLLFTALILIPLVVVVGGIFSAGEKTEAILDATVSAEDVYNTFRLAVSVALASFVMGTVSAWLVTQYRFPLRKFFQWALLLPLTIPGYILAFTWAGIFSFYGSYHSLLGLLGVTDQKAWHFDIMTFPFLVLILSFSLFPYVYITSKNAFTGRFASHIESARSMGVSSLGIFFRIALPLSRPAIAAGLFLVIMETLNDYGASSYFGIRTLTTAIFRSWQYDLGAALWIAAVLFFAVFVFLSLERVLRGKKSYTENIRSVSSPGKILSGWKKITALLFCSALFLFAFLIPFAQIIYWSWLTFEKVVTEKFVIMAWNSFVLAFIAAVTVTSVALLVAYARHTNRIRLLSSVSSIGYALPGAIIAVGVLVVSGTLDHFFSEYILMKKGLIFTGSIFFLVFAYVVRFLAVGYQPVEAAFQKQSLQLSASARSMGKNTWFTFFKIDLPVIKATVISAFILVFVDVLKELPLTMILRPFDFNTLATETYRHAKVMESVPESSNAALIIVLTGMIPLYLLHRLMNKKNA